MTEKEFRKLVSDVEVSKQIKEDMLNIINEIENIFICYKNKHYEIVNLYRGGALSKGTMLNSSKDIDIIMEIKPNINKIFGLVNRVVMNEIANAIIVSIDEINKVSDIVINENILLFKYKEYSIKLIVRYTDKVTEDMDISLLNNVELLRNKFVELANNDYTYFRNTIQIIKYYREEQKISNISGLILEVLLYYSLTEYCFDTRYEDYINAFIKGLDDFLLGKRIEVPMKMYQELGVNPSSEIKKGYVVIDVGTGLINLTSDVNEIRLGDYRKLKKALAKLVDTKAVKDMGNCEVKLNVNPQKNKDGSYSWSFKIEDTSISGIGGTYSSSNEDTYTAIYKALLKGFKAIVDNGLNRKGVKLICSKNDILTNEQGLSNENNARRKNVLTYIDNNNITIAK